MAIHLHEGPDPLGVVTPRTVAFKVLFLGDSAVGKTSLLRQYVCQEYDPSSRSTIGTDFLRKDLVAPGGDAVVMLQLWDTAGQERFQTLTSAFFRAADACVLVFDLCHVESFQSLAGWLAEAETKCGPGKVCAVVGNKRDMVPGRQVPSDAAQRWCLEVPGPHCSVRYFETSALDHASVAAVFQHITALALRKPPDSPSAPSTPTPLPPPTRRCC
jgi:Ras-related protein Rab-7A